MQSCPVVLPHDSSLWLWYTILPCNSAWGLSHAILPCHSAQLLCQAILPCESALNFCPWFYHNCALPSGPLILPSNSALWFHHRYWKSLNRLLKVCYVPTPSANFKRQSFFFFFIFLLRPLTVLMKQTRQAVRAIKQSILLSCLWIPPTIGTAYLPWPPWMNWHK
jgi:hypothetical protein